MDHCRAGSAIRAFEMAKALAAAGHSVRLAAAPGSHTLRVAQERHTKRGRDRWLHAARVSELELPIVPLAGK